MAKALNLVKTRLREVLIVIDEDGNGVVRVQGELSKKAPPSLIPSRRSYWVTNAGLWQAIKSEWVNR